MHVVSLDRPLQPGLKPQAAGSLPAESDIDPLRDRIRTDLRQRCGQRRGLPDPLLQGHLDYAVRKSLISTVEFVIRKSRDDVKVDMKDVLTAVPLVVLAYRNTVGT